LIARWRRGSGVGLAIGRSRVQSSHSSFECSPRQVSHTHLLSPSRIIWHSRISWEVNRHTTDGPISMVLQIWLVACRWPNCRERSVLAYGLSGVGLTLLIYLLIIFPAIIPWNKEVTPPRQHHQCWGPWLGPMN